MRVTEGRPEVVIGLIDGPVAIDHPELVTERISTMQDAANVCVLGQPACAHGTFVAGILAARRGTDVPAVCPGCTLLVRPIFGGTPQSQAMPAATSQELAAAILECMAHGARLVNVSAALMQPRGENGRELSEALRLASRCGVVVVAAAGNDGVVGSSAMTRHPWVIPVVAYSRMGRPLPGSNLSGSIARHGLGALGEDVTSLAPDGGRARSGGTSAAAPFVTGAAALLWSEFPDASGVSIRLALTRSAGRVRQGVVPALLDAWAAYQVMARIA
jgi:subtilisin family serine protease